VAAHVKGADDLTRAPQLVVRTSINTTVMRQRFPLQTPCPYACILGLKLGSDPCPDSRAPGIFRSFLLLRGLFLSFRPRTKERKEKKGMVARRCLDSFAFRQSKRKRRGPGLVTGRVAHWHAAAVRERAPPTCAWARSGLPFLLAFG
jgi:hypothetical protein